MKKFGKVLTKEQVVLANEIKNLYHQSSIAYDEWHSKLSDWDKIEGKYGKLVVSDYDIGNGLRGYHYEYSNEQDKIKEQQEQDNFYNTYILPLKQKEIELSKKARIKENQLCLMVSGYNKYQYEIIQSIKDKQKEISKLKTYINNLKQKFNNTLNLVYDEYGYPME